MLDLRKTSIAAALGALALAATPLAHAQVDAFAARSGDAARSSHAYGAVDPWAYNLPQVRFAGPAPEATSEHSPVVVSPTVAPQPLSGGGDATDWGDIGIAAGLAGFLAALCGIGLGATVSRRRPAHV